jgi:hypothetical protein
MRQSRPGIKVVPVDSGADIKTAEVRAGMIRYVENRSKAKHVYTTGADSQVTCGIGHWAVTTEYAHAGTFNQEIRIVGIEDGVSVLWDADACCRPNRTPIIAFVPNDITRAKFKKQWPDAVADGFDTGIYGLGSSGCFDTWGIPTIYPGRPVLEEKADQAHAGADAGRLDRGSDRSGQGLRKSRSRPG